MLNKTHTFQLRAPLFVPNPVGGEPVRHDSLKVRCAEYDDAKQFQEFVRANIEEMGEKLANQEGMAELVINISLEPKLTTELYDELSNADIVAFNRHISESKTYLIYGVSAFEYISQTLAKNEV